MANYRISSFYHFMPFSEPELRRVQEELEKLAQNLGVRGLVILATEGINGSLSGETAAVESFKIQLQELLGVSGLIFKEGDFDQHAFRRFGVRVRPEIVTTGSTEFPVPVDGGKYLTPQEWEAALKSDEEIFLVDTRNDYEFTLGHFRKAVNPKLKHFSDFKPYVESLEIPKDKKVLMYCTGGIRCEKASTIMEQVGFENVFQLHGGILKYMEEFPQSEFLGECFVFDERVAVCQDLSATKQYSFCPHCGDPGDVQIHCARCGNDRKICKSCASKLEEPACSKDCRNQLSVRRERQRV